MRTIYTMILLAAGVFTYGQDNTPQGTVKDKISLIDKFFTDQTPMQYDECKSLLGWYKDQKDNLSPEDKNEYKKKLIEFLKKPWPFTFDEKTRKTIIQENDIRIFAVSILYDINIETIINKEIYTNEICKVDKQIRRNITKSKLLDLKEILFNKKAFRYQDFRELMCAVDRGTIVVNAFTISLNKQESVYICDLLKDFLLVQEPYTLSSDCYVFSTSTTPQGAARAMCLHTIGLIGDKSDIPFIVKFSETDELKLPKELIYWDNKSKKKECLEAIRTINEREAANK